MGCVMRSMSGSNYDERPRKMPTIDPKSVAGKFPPPAEHVAVAVIGAGPAGVSAAIAAGREGQQVMLIDENPIPGSLMGLDVPLFFGGRMTPAVQRPDRMVEQFLTPALAEAIELGVDVRLGTCVWGAFANGRNLQALPAPVLGLADEQHSWLVSFDRLILATGARDLVLSFPGAELPGVMGAAALHSLLARYDAFAGRQLVVLGAGELGLSTACAALDRGLDVAAVVEVRENIPGPPALADALAARRVPILTGSVIESARVDAVTVAGHGDIACDTVCLAIGLVPVIELAKVLGCETVYDPARGGHVPLLAADGITTSLPFVAAVGDCAGVAPVDADYASDWMRALLAGGGLDVLACACEEVTRREVLGVRPPRYLGNPQAPDPRSLEALAADGPLSPDQLKRLTRAGMGTCQGRRCREQIALLLSLSSGTRLADLPLASYRAPVRPLPLAVLRDAAELPEMAEHWENWFGIQGQWVPYRDIGTPREHIDRYGRPVPHD
jgi:thioredoxin reductase